MTTRVELEVVWGKVKSIKKGKIEIISKANESYMFANLLICACCWVHRMVHLEEFQQLTKKVSLYFIWYIFDWHVPQLNVDLLLHHMVFVSVCFYRSNDPWKQHKRVFLLYRNAKIFDNPVMPSKPIELAYLAWTAECIYRLNTDIHVYKAHICGFEKYCYEMGCTDSSPFHAQMHNLTTA